MKKFKLKTPPPYRDRLHRVAAQQPRGPTAEAFGLHLVERGLRVYEASGAGAGGAAGSPVLGVGVGSAPVTLGERLARVADEQGYSGPDELVEHLLERGLRAYEEPESDPAKLEARLRGLGYID